MEGGEWSSEQGPGNSLGLARSRGESDSLTAGGSWLQHGLGVRSGSDDQAAGLGLGQRPKSAVEKVALCADAPLIWHWHGVKPYGVRCMFEALGRGVPMSEGGCLANIRNQLAKNPCTLIGFARMLEVWEWWEQKLH